jgi:signal transduction histidine kinase
MMITLIGLPILTATMFVARGLADIHRWNLRAVLNRPIARPRYLRAEPEESLFRRILTPLRDGQSWLDLFAGIIDFAFALAGFIIATVWWSLALCVTSVLWEWSIPHGRDDRSLAYFLGIDDTHTNRVLIYTGIGVVATLTLPWVIRGAALMRAGVARALLVGVAEMRQQIVGLQERNAGLADQKRAAASAETTALRRIERDIHDGPQQRLVRVAMDLGRARQQMESDPDAARSTIEEALSQTRETLDELRALSRGIAPPVLTDRGLPSALAALAGRSAIPVDMRLAPDIERLSATVEATVYFVVAEALTNIAKHSSADVAAVRVDKLGGYVTVSVADNGGGGASLSKGHGLAGLNDRVHAAEGTFTVVSPEGGPTEVRAVLPCG